MKIHLRLLTATISFFLSISAIQANSVGTLPESVHLEAQTEVSLPKPAVMLNAVAGQPLRIGPLPTKSSLGHSITYFWSSEAGTLRATSLSFNEVYYTVPVLASGAEDLIYFVASSSSGLVEETEIRVSFQPSAPSSPPQGQLSAQYNESTTNFSSSFSIADGMSRAWIQASTDGTNFTTVHSIDPVTASNRVGNATVSVPGSGSVSQVYFRLRTQSGAGQPVDGMPIVVAYSPPPPTPKTTELPAAPALIINGRITDQPSAFLSWQRVNDIYHRDNVNYYEVEYASNPDFSGATIENVGNNAPSQSVYGSASCKISGLDDDLTWFFRVRGVNSVGDGPWSDVDSIRVDVQDRPSFDLSPTFPTHLGTAISKTPALEFECTDPDNDELDFYIYFGTTPDAPIRLRGFDDSEWKGVQRVDPSEWSAPLEPNTRYYWRVEVREAGRDKAFYGGSYPSSPTWEFVTENTGSSLSISNVTLVSGTIQPEAPLTYRLTVTNNGNEPSMVNYLKVAYVKNGTESQFSSTSVTPPVFPALNPGQSTTTDVSFRFRNELWTSPSGVVHDNILIVGSSAIRFFFQDSIQNLGAVTYTLPITYANSGGPTFNSFFLSNNTTGNRGGVPRGGTLQIAASIRDDVRTSRALIEYRLHPQSAWTLLDDYTGNTTQTMRFGQSNHSGPTISSTTNNTAITWAVPANFPLTSTLEMRITAYDDQGIASYGISPGFAIYDDTLIVTAGSVDAAAYRIGQSARIPVTVTTPMVVGFYKVTYRRSVGGDAEDLLTVTGNGLTPLVVPPILTIPLPSNPYMASDNAVLEVTVGASAGYGGRNVSDTSDNTFSLRMGDLPAPFHNAVAVPLSGTFTFPVGSTSQSTWVTSKAMDWEGETALHILAEEGHSYTLAGMSYNPDPIQYWLRYDRDAQSFTQGALPSGYVPVEVRLVGTTPYVLLQNGNSAYLTSRNGGVFSTPQLLEALPVLYSDEHFLVKRGSNELYYSFTAYRDQVSNNRRNSLKRILPTPATTIEHPGVWHGRFPCYGTHLSGQVGIYPLNADLTLGTPIATWVPPPYYPLRFTNATGPVVGCRIVAENGIPWLETYDESASASRWALPLERANVRSFASHSIAVGTTPAGRPDSEGFVVTRRLHSRGTETTTLVGKRPGNNDPHKVSAISEGGLVAVSWSTFTGYLAIGDMSGDITAPAVQITTSNGNYVTGQPTALAWTMSDNLNQLAALKVIKIANGVTTEVASYTGGTIPTGLTLTINDTTATVTVRVEAYDQSGNRGVAEKVLTRISSFTFSGFSATDYDVSMGTSVQLNWSATPADAFRVYNILTRPQGTTAWTAAASVAGGTYLLDTSLLSGAVEVRLESGGVVRDLPQAILVTGNRFAFDNSVYSPTSGTVYFASTNPVLELTWATNQAESAAIPYTVLGRFATSGPGSTLAPLGRTTTKTLDVSVGNNSMLEYRVVARWEEQEFISATRSVSLMKIGAGPVPTATVGGRGDQTPWVDITWPPVPGVDGVVIYREDATTNRAEEIARITGSSYRDDEVSWGDSIRYRLAAIVGSSFSDQGSPSSVTITPLLPVGIEFITADYQQVSGNGHFVQWQALMPDGATGVFERYRVALKRGDGTIVRVGEVAPADGALPSATWNDLEYNQSYQVEVTAENQTGDLLSEQPVRLFFTTGQDSRPIGLRPTVRIDSADREGIALSWSATPNTDSYDVYRKRANGTLEWVGRSNTAGFLDVAASAGEPLSYVVRARNGNTQLDSLPSPLVTRKPFFSTNLTSQLLRDTEATTLSSTVASVLPVTLDWQHNAKKIAGATGNSLPLAAGSAAAGVYKVTGKTALGSFSSSAEITVVSTTDVVVPVKQGSSVALRSAFGNQGVYEWSKDGAGLFDGGSVKGSTKQTLTLAKADTSTEGFYTCDVTAFGRTTTSGRFHLVLAEKPLLLSQQFDPCAVGSWFEHDIAYDTSRLNQKATVFAVSGLPPGLKLNSATGRITGRPLKSGPFTLAIVASNAAGSSSTLRTVLTVEALDPFIVGTWTALIPRGDASSLGGTMTFTVSKTSSVTGSLRLGGVVSRFIGSLNADGLLTGTPRTALLDQGVKVAGRSLPVRLLLSLDDTNGMTGEISTSSAPGAPVTGYRNPWTKGTGPTAFAGYYTAKFETTQEPPEIRPEGFGYCRFVIDPSLGVLTVIGKLPDGTAITSSTFVGPRGQVMVFRPLYQTKGSINGTMQIFAAPSNPDNTLTGSVQWSRPSIVGRIYPDGFGPFFMTATGARYTPSTPLLVSTTGLFSFLGAGVDGVLPSPDETVSVTLSTKNVIAGSGPAVPNTFKATYNSKTGLVTGSFMLPTPVSRQVKFDSIMVDEGSTTTAAGYFHLPGLPAVGEKSSTTQIKSGAVIFEILP